MGQGILDGTEGYRLHGGDGEERLTLYWRSGLALLALFNFGLLVWAALLLPCESALQRYQRWLGTPYVLQTVWRSVFISEYVHRRTITSSKWNAPLLARLAAAVGEVCFGLQLSLELWRRWDAPLFPRVLPCVLIPALDLCGQVCATVGTALQHNGFFFAEGLLWTAMFSVCALSALLNGVSIGFWAAVLLASGAAVLYMGSDYCPMCWRAWASQPRRPVSALALRKGLWDALTLMEPTQRWQDWKDEWLWQSLYFSLGSWCSIWLMVVEPTAR